MHVEEENGNDGHGDQRRLPTHYKHDNNTQNSSDKAHPHGIELECRPPAYSIPQYLYTAVCGYIMSNIKCQC